MPRPRYLLAAALLLVLTFAPLTGWPTAQVSAYAQSARAGSTTTPGLRAWSLFDALTVATSNENERKDREDRRGREENDNHDDDNADDSGPPPPPPARMPAPPPPDQVSGCLQNGGSVTLELADGRATFKAFQDNLSVELTKVDPSSVPSPGNLVGQLVFRLSASQCGGQGLGALPGEGNLGVSYRNRAAAGHDQGKFALMFWDGQQWTPAPKQANDPGNSYVSATVAALGIYALVQQ